MNLVLDWVKEKRRWRTSSWVTPLSTRKSTDTVACSTTDQSPCLITTASMKRSQESGVWASSVACEKRAAHSIRRRQARPSPFVNSRTVDSGWLEPISGIILAYGFTMVISYSMLPSHASPLGSPTGQGEPLGSSKDLAPH